MYKCKMYKGTFYQNPYTMFLHPSRNVYVVEVKIYIIFYTPFIAVTPVVEVGGTEGWHPTTYYNLHLSSLQL